MTEQEQKKVERNKLNEESRQDIYFRLSVVDLNY
jgi:hypothetical protein